MSRGYDLFYSFEFRFSNIKSNVKSIYLCIADKKIISIKPNTDQKILAFSKLPIPICRESAVLSINIEFDNDDFAKDTCFNKILIKVGILDTEPRSKVIRDS